MTNEAAQLEPPLGRYYRELSPDPLVRSVQKITAMFLEAMRTDTKLTASDPDPNGPLALTAEEHIAVFHHLLDERRAEDARREKRHRARKRRRRRA